MTEDKTYIYHLAALSDIFFDAAEGLMTENQALGDQIDATVTEEEKQEQRELYMARLYPPGHEPTEDELQTLARVIIKFGDNGARIIGRTVDIEDLKKLVPDELKTVENSEGFKAHNAPDLARIYAPK